MNKPVNCFWTDKLTNLANAEIIIEKTPFSLRLAQKRLQPERESCKNTRPRNHQSRLDKTTNQQSESAYFFLPLKLLFSSNLLFWILGLGAEKYKKTSGVAL